MIAAGTQHETFSFHFQISFFIYGGLYRPFIETKGIFHIGFGRWFLGQINQLTLFCCEKKILYHG
jgi:hypothetical protein